ncbi:MAG: hypothetical protein ACK40O_00880 [Allosphingosinicella sp.]
MALDLDKVRELVASAPAKGPAAIVSRKFLEQLLAEVEAGRAALVQMNESVGRSIMVRVRPLLPPPARGGADVE